MKKLLLSISTAAILASCGSGAANVENVESSENESNASEVVADQNVEAQKLVVDAASSELLWEAGKVVGGGHNGTVAIKDGSLEIAGGKLVGGEVVIDINTLTSTDLEGEYQEKLNGHLKSADFFNVEKFPTAKLVIKSVDDKGNVKADLSILDKTNEVSFPATINVSEDGVDAQAEVTIDRTKWGLIYGSGNFFKELTQDKVIKDEFTLKVNLKAAK